MAVELLAIVLCRRDFQGGYTGISSPPETRQRRRTMRSIDLVSVSLMLMMSPVTDANAASNRWCASVPKRSENCGYATLDQCRAYVLGLGAGVDRIRSLGRRLGLAAPGRRAHRASHPCPWCERVEQSMVARRRHRNVTTECDQGIFYASH